MQLLLYLLLASAFPSHDASLMSAAVKVGVLNKGNERDTVSCVHTKHYVDANCDVVLPFKDTAEKDIVLRGTSVFMRILFGTVLWATISE